MDGGGGMTGREALPVLIVTGLKQEARIAAGPGLTVICSSSNPVQLRQMMFTFDPASIRGIVSFGVAGGLNPDLQSGDIVLASEVIAGKERWETSSELFGDMIATPVKRRRRVTSGILVGVEQVVTGQSGKAALRATTGGDAVDMESHIAARYAAENALPFAALRVISDPASRALPVIATSAIKSNGDVDTWKVVRGVARNPRSIPALVSTARDFNRAMAGLRSCRGFLSFGGGFVAADL